MIIILSPYLNRDSNIPLYEQLYDYIKKEIIKGNLKTNDKLPSKNNLSKHLDISVNTITSAYESLIDEGYIYSIERKGYYVCAIDNLAKVNINTEEINIKKSNIPDYKYNFKFNSIDTKNFPIYTWRKISKEVILDSKQTWLKSRDPQGLKELRICISNYLRQSRDVHTNPENIIISSGIEYLFQILFYILPKNSIYATENPGYKILNDLFNINNIKYNPIDIDDYGISFELLKNTDSNIVFTTPSHQFPTGIIMPIQRRVEILNWANDNNNRYIIEDDYDSEFKYYGQPIPALKSLDKNDKVIYMGNFSKSISPGIRISYMVLPDKLVHRYQDIMPFMNCPVSNLNQLTIAKFMSDGYFERHLNKMRNIYNKKRKILIKSFSKYNSCRIIDSKAGFHFIVEFDTDLSEKEIVKKAKDKKIFVQGLSDYNYKKGSRFIFNNKPKIIFGYGNINKEDLIKGTESFMEIFR